MLYIKSRNCLTQSCVSCCSKSILKSPQTSIVLLMQSLLRIVSMFLQKVDDVCPGALYIQLINILLCFFRLISIVTHLRIPSIATVLCFTIFFRKCFYIQRNTPTSLVSSESIKHIITWYTVIWDTTRLVHPCFSYCNNIK